MVVDGKTQLNARIREIACLQVVLVGGFRVAFAADLAVDVPVGEDERTEGGVRGEGSAVGEVEDYVDCTSGNGVRFWI